MSAPKQQLAWILGSMGLILFVDQVSKAIVIASLEPGTPYRPDTFFYFVHLRNSGLIGGMFRDIPLLPYIAPTLATLILIYLFRHLDPLSRWQSLGYGLVLGGAVGNLIDRIRFQSVTDFLQFHFYFIPFDFPWKFYPAFNIADSAILVGVILLVLVWNNEERDDAPSTA